MFNYVVKVNEIFYKEYIINAFNYMLRDMASNWCYNYMSKFPNCIFLEFKHHRKIQNDKQIYMELNNKKQKETKRVEVYYEWIQKLVHGLQVPTICINNFLTIVFRTGL
jgi:hypothetical protein